MRLGIVGRGWGNAYAKTLAKLKIPFWQDTHGWHMHHADGLIIASPPETHYEIARCALGRKIPVLVEKPVTLRSEEAQELVDMGGIAFAGHTRLYSPAWRYFKRYAPTPYRVEAWAGGTDKDPWWDWGPHLVAMSMDLGWDSPVLHLTKEPQPLVLTLNEDLVFQDRATDPMPLEVLVGEFVAAIECGKPNNEGLQLGLRVVQFLESHEPSRLHGA